MSSYTLPHSANRGRQGRSGQFSMENEGARRRSDTIPRGEFPGAEARHAVLHCMGLDSCDYSRGMHHLLRRRIRQAASILRRGIRLRVFLRRRPLGTDIRAGGCRCHDPVRTLWNTPVACCGEDGGKAVRATPRINTHFTDGFPQDFGGNGGMPLVLAFPADCLPWSFLQTTRMK